MEPVPVLVGVEGILAGRSFEVTTTGLRLGREPGNEVTIDDAGVSRQHARVILHNGAVWVQDAGSRNGVFVNGERVADHRTLKPGDRVSVGAHTFELTLSTPAAAARAASLPPQPAPRNRPDARTVSSEMQDPEVTGTTGSSTTPKRWKAWPFAVALFFTVICIGCFGAYGWMRGPSPTATATPAGPTYSLSTVLPPDGAAPGAGSPGSAGAPPGTGGGGGTAGPPTVSDALAVASGADAEAQRAKLPDAPAGTTSAELVERAHALYDTGRLNEARTTYEMALKLDPACEICKVRIERLNAEITEKAQAQLDAGMRYYHSMQVQQAVAAWETVLMLVPDEADPLHQKAAGALAQAKSQGAPSP